MKIWPNLVSLLCAARVKMIRLRRRSFRARSAAVSQTSPSGLDVHLAACQGSAPILAKRLECAVFRRFRYVFESFVVAKRNEKRRNTAHSKRFASLVAAPPALGASFLLSTFFFLLSFPAPAFPPAPDHVIYGLVRDEYGVPLSVGNAQI